MLTLIAVSLLSFVAGGVLSAILGSRVKASLEQDLTFVRAKVSRLEAALAADLAKVKKKL